MLRGIHIAESGLRAANHRLNAAASNIAHAHSTGALPSRANSAPTPAPYTPVTVEQSADPEGGTTTRTVEVSKPSVPLYDPASPYADTEGLIAAPNVDLATEMTNLILARQDFLANAAVLRVTDEMLKRLYDLADSHG